MFSWPELFFLLRLIFYLMPVAGFLLFFGIAGLAEEYRKKNEKVGNVVSVMALACIVGTFIAILGLGVWVYVDVENKYVVSRLKIGIPLYGEDVGGCTIYYNITKDNYISYIKEHSKKPPMERVLIICGNKIEYADKNNTYVQEFLNRVEEEKKLTPDEEFMQNLGKLLLLWGDGVILLSCILTLVYLTKNK